MNIGGQRGKAGWAVVAAIVCAVAGVPGCRPMPTAASEAPSSSGTRIADRAAAAGGGGATDGARVFGEPDGAQESGHVGWDQSLAPR